MSKTFSFFLTLATVAGIFGFWIFQNSKIVQQNSTSETAEIVQLPASKTPRTSQLNLSAQPSNDLAKSEQIAEYESEKIKLTERKQNLENLQSQFKMKLQQVSSDYPNLISANAVEAENLTDLLETERFKASQIERAAQLQLQEQLQTVDSINQQAEPLAQPFVSSLQTTQKEIESVTSSPYINPIDKELRIQILQSNLVATSDQLQNLLSQVAENSTTSQNQISQTTAAIEQRRAQSTVEQAELQETIFSLRNEIARLQAEERTTRQELQATNQQMQDSKKMYEEQLQKVQNLEVLIR